ncbi:cell division protein FtsQ/DivIB [Sphingobium phenoxybenzoativorans]|uniref:cell division protein FtsQ/DivIB n=1 Tax=Sphingobium phenoxybenzoativorans TaxID=1592790 RepID=UPI0008721F24|nr:cell division protein FtsQ/DivIB [Sphingobium phenoxybenzoativorans]
MSDARIRRGSTSRLSPPRRKSGTKVTSRRGGRTLKRQSFADRIISAIPVSEATMQRMATWGIVGAVIVAAVGGAGYFGLPGMMRMEFAQAAAHAGFEVDKVEVRGVERMDELQVYNIALGQVDRSMVNVDLPKLRGDLMKLGWVKDARVSRRLPDTLVVDIVERQPVAVWQHGGNLALIDVTGAVLQPVSQQTMPDLPLVVGPSANLQTANLGKLMDAAPALKPMLAGATWVGDRRWDLRFQSGETLSLPEGEKPASAALLNFARLDGVNHLLGRGIVRFDMRDPSKFVLRLPKDRGPKPEEKTETKAAEAASKDGEV